MSLKKIGSLDLKIELLGFEPQPQWRCHPRPHTFFTIKYFSNGPVETCLKVPKIINDKEI